MKKNHDDHLFDTYGDWQLRLREWPLPLPRFSLDLDRSALLIVDMQYGNVDPSSGISRYLRDRFPQVADYRDRIREVAIPNIQRLLQFFRDVGRPVVYVTLGHALEDRSDGLELLRQIDDDLKKQMATGPLVRLGSRGNVVLEAVAPRDGDLIINKTSMSAFNSTAIDQLLRNMGITMLVVTGASIECCVSATAHDASDRGYKVLLVEDACTAVTPYLRDSSLVIFSAMFGRVATTDEALDELAASLGLSTR